MLSGSLDLSASYSSSLFSFDSRFCLYLGFGLFPASILWLLLFFFVCFDPRFSFCFQLLLGLCFYLGFILLHASRLCEEIPFHPLLCFGFLRVFFSLDVLLALSRFCILPFLSWLLLLFFAGFVFSFILGLPVVFVLDLLLLGFPNLFCSFLSELLHLFLSLFLLCSGVVFILSVAYFLSMHIPKKPVADNRKAPWRLQAAAMLQEELPGGHGQEVCYKEAWSGCYLVFIQC